MRGSNTFRKILTKEVLEHHAVQRHNGEVVAHLTGCTIRHVRLMCKEHGIKLPRKEKSSNTVAPEEDNYFDQFKPESLKLAHGVWCSGEFSNTCPAVW